MLKIVNFRKRNGWDKQLHTSQWEPTREGDSSRVSHAQRHWTQLEYDLRQVQQKIQFAGRFHAALNTIKQSGVYDEMAKIHSSVALSG